jgi:nitroreductase
MTPQRPPKEVVTKLLTAAVRAPTHHLTQPWRFIVLTGEGLDRLGEAMAGRVERQYAGTDDLPQRVALEKKRPHRAPVIVAVVYRPSENPKAIEREDRYAVGAAMQNLLLAAHSLGFGAYLRTGPAAEDPGVGEFLGLLAGEEVAGFIYLGYPGEAAEPLPLSERDDATARTTWVGW